MGSVCVRSRAGTLAVALGLVSLFIGSTVCSAQASDSKVTDKTKRQIRIMEKIMDEVLRDSPNLLVFSTDPTHGIYLDEFGVVFTFEASLVGKDLDFLKPLSLLNDIRVKTENGKVTVWSESKDEKEKEASGEKSEISSEDEEGDEADEDDSNEHLILSVKKRAQRQADLYTKGKAELVDALIDYGETVSVLRDDQWVAIAAFLKDSDFFTSTKMSQLIVKARVRDLRAVSDNTLTREAALARVVVEEY